MGIIVQGCFELPRGSCLEMWVCFLLKPHRQDKTPKTGSYFKDLTAWPVCRTVPNASLYNQSEASETQLALVWVKVLAFPPPGSTGSGYIVLLETS